MTGAGARGTSSQALLARVAAGDKGALEQLFVRYRRTAVATAQRLTGRLEDAEDIVQEAFLRIMSGAARFRGARGDISFRRWLRSIVDNLARDLARQRRRTAAPARARVAHPGEPGSVEGSFAMGAVSVGQAEVGADHPVEDEVESRLVTASVRRALGSLPGLYRAVVVLKDFHHRSYREISETLHCSVESVRSRLYRARRLLRKALQRDFPDL